MNNDKIQQNRLWNFRQIIKNVGGIFLHRYACFPLINHLVLSYVMRIASQSITEIDMKNIIKRAFIWFAIYELDITIKGQTACLEVVSSPLLQFRIEIARSNARRERTRLRGEYESTFPVCTRRTWTLG